MKGDEEHWVRTLIKLIWEQCHTIWLTRKKDRHGHDKASSAQISADQTCRKIAALYLLRDHVEDSVKDIFHQDLNKHLEDHPTELRNWLTIYKPVIMKSSRSVKQAAKANTRQLSAYFEKITRIRPTRKPPNRPPRPKPPRKPLRTTFLFNYIPDIRPPRIKSAPHLEYDDTSHSHSVQSCLSHFYFPDHPK
mmetsp:Transcript_32276/g.48152  ORF Transcript_32276/g.48152 Transcript_32276/m.48152 type:complete len:192 (-) Transcript_32276:208-783(-)